MEGILSWISSLELTTVHIVSIVIFAIYIFVSGIVFVLTFSLGRGYMDLAKGLRCILDRQNQKGQMDDIPELSEEIIRYYASYCKYNPSIHQRYDGINSWMDDILLQTNMFQKGKGGRKKRFGIWFDEYYDTLLLVQEYFDQKFPYYSCTSGQRQLLEELSSLKNDDNGDIVKKLTAKTEAEFVRLNRSDKKNSRANFVSIAIGVAGIIVSVLLTVLQMFG